jgi:DNA-binding transcriptional LysR family regulator
MPLDERLGRRLKLRDLQTLMSVVEAGGIRKAADRLNYTQPAVSKAIASLERSVGKRLLERSRRGIELTPYGEAVIKCGIAVFDDLRKGIADIESLADPTAGEVRIGCTEPVAAGIVSAVMDRLVQRHPRIRFQVLLRDTATLHRELVARNIDVLIAQMDRLLDDKNTQSEILYYESIAVVASVHHPAANRRRIQISDLLDEAWALPPPQSFVTSIIAQAFRKSGLELPSTAVTGSAYLRIVMVVSGGVITALPATMLKASILPLRALPVMLPTNRRPVRIVTLKNRSLSPVAELFVDQTRTVAKAIS